MPAAEALPTSIVAQFRATSIERLERIEGAWGALTQRVAAAEAESELFHDIHTLKGESRLVGFADVVLLTQRLEDLLVAAKRRRYRVTEDVDVLVTMAIQFTRMLLRKRAGVSQGGIDINGFLKQIDDVLAEWPRQSEVPEEVPGHVATRTAEGGKVSVAVRQRLGGAATEIFLELVATQDSPRLRRAWSILVGELAQLDAVPLLPLVRRHASSAKDVAAELGKEVDVVIDGPDVRVGIEVLDVIHAALLHTLRNAVDHGIEAPEQRLQLGKTRRGNIVVRHRVEGDEISVTVQDDGGGIDVESVRRRAVKVGLLGADAGESATEAALLELTFAPGFSSREAATNISGRGIGLDAVRAGIERLGGRITLASKRHVGVTVELRLPFSRRVIEVHRLPATRPGLAFAVPTTWTIRSERREDAVDLVDVLGLRTGPNAHVSATLAHIVLSRDGEDHALIIGGSVSRVAATRVCPTSPDDGLEVVSVDDERMLLIRPDVFFGTIAQSKRS